MTGKAEQIHTQSESIRDEKSPMKSILDLTSDAVKSAMEILLKDRATGENILFATEENDGISFDSQMTKKWVYGEGLEVLRPRVLKRLEEQSKRTRKRAEVFTPSWICNKMNNHCDVEWFGRKNPFSNNEYSTCVSLKDSYYLAIAAETNYNIEVCFIKNPVEKLHFEKELLDGIGYAGNMRKK